MLTKSNTKNEILIPSEYAPLFESWWREAAIHGGRGSLKSHTVARILLIRAMSKRGRAGCFREYQNSIADSSHSLLKNLIEEYELPHFRVTNDGIVNLKTGYDFIFRGLHNNIQSVKSIEGMTEAWVEEAQTITEDSLDVLTPTVRVPGSQIFYTYNRLRDKDPIHKRLVIEGRPNTLIIEANYEVAEKYGWFSDVLRNEMESDRDNRPEIYKHKWLGQPSTLKGLIYPNWKKIPNIPAGAEYVGNGLDFGYTNDPTAIINIYKFNRGYVLDELCYNTGMKNKAIAGLLKSNEKQLGRKMTVAESAEPKSIDEIIDEGYTAIEPAVKGPGSLNNGIQRLQEVEIYYTARSHNIEEEQLNYMWKVDRQDKSLNIPIDAYNHAMDAVRYKIMRLESIRPLEYGGVR